MHVQSLVDPRKVLLTPFHIQLGIMKQFVKAMLKDSDKFQFSCQVSSTAVTGKAERRDFNRSLRS